MNNTIKLWSFLFLFNLMVISPAVSGQTNSNTKTDSLRMVVDKKSGKEKISAELELALQLLNTDKDEALQLATAVLPQAKAIADRKLKMNAYYVLGRVYADLENSKLSMAYLDSALLIAEATGDNWHKGEILYHIGLRKYRLGEVIEAMEAFNASVQACRLSDNFRFSGSSYAVMGAIFRMNGLYDRAIEYNIKAELNYEKARFTEGSAWSHYLLGRIYYDLKHPQIALRYFQQSLEIYLRLAAIDRMKDGVAICYEQIGTLYIELGNFDEARECFDNTLEIYTASKSKYGISNVYKNLGILEYSKGNYLLAENHLNKSLEIKNEVDDKLSVPVIYEYLGLCMIAKGLKQEGLTYLQQGLDMAVTNNQKKIQLDILSKLTKAWLDVNNLKKAIDCQNQQIQIQDLILSGAANIKTEQLQTIYEIDKKNSQIAELEKQNKITALSIKQQRMIRNIMIAGIILAISISVIIYWFNKKLQLKNLELNETNATKDKFFDIIAHDLRGPTSSLASLLEHLSSKFDEYSVTELKVMLQVMHKSAENVSNLLENLLIWARSQVNRIEYRPIVLNLTDVIQNSLKGLNQTAERKQIDITVHCNEQIFVLADPDMVQTIVRNILSNAIKFTHRGGKVAITTAATGKNTATISITDNGVGIEKSKLSKIFDNDSPLHTNGTENEKSTGLGFILVKDFVEKNKGTLTIDSETDKGTTVSFTLPLAQEAIISSSVKQS